MHTIAITISRSFQCFVYLGRMWRHFLIILPFIYRPYPRALPEGADWEHDTLRPHVGSQPISTHWIANLHAKVVKKQKFLRVMA